MRDCIAIIIGRECTSVRWCLGGESHWSLHQLQCLQGECPSHCKSICYSQIVDVQGAVNSDGTTVANAICDDMHTLSCTLFGERSGGSSNSTIAALQSEDIRLVGCCGDRQFAIRTARARAVDSAVYVEEPVREVEHAERQRAKIG